MIRMDVANVSTGTGRGRGDGVSLLRLLFCAPAAGGAKLPYLANEFGLALRIVSGD